MSNPFQQQYQQALQTFGSRLGGLQQTGSYGGTFTTTTGNPWGDVYYPTTPGLTPTITITPVKVPVEYDAAKAVQVLFRFGRGLVQACVIRGTNDVLTAKNVFLGQFMDEEPEIVAVVEVSI